MSNTVKAPAKRAVKRAIAPPEPPELANMYGAPKLSRARGAGTTGEEVETSLDFDTSAPVADMPMERLFSIDGKAYHIPVEFPPAYGLVYLDALEGGRDVAVGKALKLAIGAQGWKALRDLCEQRPDVISPAQLAVLMDKVLTKIMGAIEESGEGNG
jgi:hypothetical protein